MSGGAVSTALPFRRLVHCDWSVGPAKRWRADAIRADHGWRLDLPRLVGDLPRFVADLLGLSGPVIAGFDLPVGLPEGLGRRTGERDFRRWLCQLGQPGPWSEFFLVNDAAEGIRLQRPFFPNRWRPGINAAQLTAALDVERLDDLRRRCERAQQGGRAATPLFWTVGPAQVGKAAISGWRDVLQPALARDALMWPFDGPLDRLVRSGRPVLAETYPGEAYGRIGLRFGPRRSKSRADDRALAAVGLIDRCRASNILLTPTLAEAIADGFAGFGRAGEDAFDALAGLLGMIEVVEGRQSALPPGEGGSAWEGWILGRGGATSAGA